VAMSSLFVRVRKNRREGTYLCGVCLGVGLRGRGGIEERVCLDGPVQAVREVRNEAHTSGPEQVSAE